MKPGKGGMMVPVASFQLHAAHLDAPTQPPMGHGNCWRTSYANFNARKFLWVLHKSYLYVRYGRAGRDKMR